MLKTRHMILSGLFAAITALLAQISIPLPFSPVPITGQTFAVFLTGAVLGGRWGALSMLLYIFLGAIGLPVFHNAQGGLHIVLGPTGGYLWGLCLAATCWGKSRRNGVLISRLSWACSSVWPLTSCWEQYSSPLLPAWICAKAYCSAPFLFFPWIL